MFVFLLFQCTRICILQFYFILLYYKILEARFLVRDRKGLGLDGKEVGETGRTRGRGNHNEDILCEKIHFQQKKEERVESMKQCC